jgi:hypothetical protein
MLIKSQPRRPAPNPRLIALASSVCLAALGPAWAISPAAPDATKRPSVSSAEGARVVTLDELGYRDGVVFSGLSGKVDLYFPVPGPAWTRSMRLRLPYSTQAAFESRRSVQLTVGGRTLFDAPLGKEATSGVIDVPVALDAIHDGYVRATLTYSGAITENRCMDRRQSGDTLSFAPDGGLAEAVEAGSPPTVASAIALMPREVTVQLPAAASEAQAAAALTLAAANSHAEIVPGAAPGAEDPARGLILIDGPASPALRAAPHPGASELILGGPNPAADARAIASTWTGLFDATSVQRISTTASPSRDLRFIDLNADSRSIEIGDTGGWSVGLPMARLPAGKTIEGLSVDVAVAVEDAAVRPIVSVWFNGLMLGSAPANQAGPTHLRVPVPEGLVEARNSIEVRVTRQRRQDCGDFPQSYPAQLLGSSEVLLGDAARTTDFFQLAPMFHSGVTVVVPNAAALPLAAKVVSGLAGPGAVIAVSYGVMPAAGPVILISAEPPPGAKPRLSFGASGAALVNHSDQPLFSASRLETLTTAQLLEVDGRVVLWLRPGARAPIPTELWLDRGDVAFIGAAGVEMAAATGRDRLVDVHDRAMPKRAGFLPSHWTWAAGAGALVLLMLFVWAAQPSNRRRSR